MNMENTPLIDGQQRASGGANEQFVAFAMDEELFAFDMAKVLEIIRVPKTVKVPLAPTCLLGLANLRGTVLPVMDLRAGLELPVREYDDATRVVVTNCGCHLGLVVDRVDRVMEIEPDRIESSDTVKTTINAEAIAGVIHDQEGHLIQILEVDRVLSSTLPVMTDMVKEGQLSKVAGTVLEEKENGDVDDDICQLVTFLVDGQEYGFAIASVEETVRVPEEINIVPQTGNHVLGIIDLRGRLLPLLSLRRLFAMSDTPLGSHNRILVLGLETDGGSKHLVGLVVDEVREVLSVSADTMEQVPSILAKREKLGEIEAVCRLDNGNRLISVVNSGLLFEHPGVQAAMNAGIEEAAMERNMVESTVVSEEEEIQMVVFQLASQEYGVMIEAVQEITRVPEEMNRVPKTPKFIEGLINLRGTVLPVLDLRLRFDLPCVERNERQRILVLNHNGVRTGYIVDSVNEVLRFSKSMVEDAPPLSDVQAQIMGKVVNMKDAGRIIQVIEDTQLLNEQEIKELAATEDTKE